MTKQQDSQENDHNTNVTLNRKENDTSSTSGEQARQDFRKAIQLDRRVGDLLLATQFFTRLPVPIDRDTGERPLAEAAWAFSLVGCIIGVAGGATASLASDLPSYAAALLAVVVMCAVSGGLHEDGLADCADGMWGGVSPQQRITIMRDSKTGVFGVIAIVTVISLKTAAISNLLSVGGGLAAALAIVAAASASRGFLPIIMRAFPVAAETGRAVEAGSPTTQDVIVGGIISIFITFTMIGFNTSINGLIVGSLLAGGLGYLAVKRLGGHTGDVLGAQQQILETAILLAATL